MQIAKTGIITASNFNANLAGASVAIASEPKNVQQTEISRDDLEDILLNYYINEAQPSKQRLKDIMLSDPFAKNIEMTKEIFKKLKYES